MKLIACPYWAPKEVKELWLTWTETQKHNWIKNWRALSDPELLSEPVPLAWRKPITDTIQ